MRRGLSFRLRLGLSILGMGTLAVAIVLGSYGLVVDRVVKQESQARADIVMQMLQKLAYRSFLQYEFIDLQSFIEQLENDSSLNQIYVVNQKQRVVASMHRKFIGRLAEKLPSPDESITFSEYKISTGQIQLGQIIVWFNRPELLSSLNKAQSVAIISGVVAVLLMALTSIFISRIFSKRIVALSNSVQQFGAGKHHHRVEVEGNDEVASLGRHFNLMADQVTDILEELKSYQQSLRETLDQTTEVIQVMDAACQIQFVNSAWQDLIGYHYADIIGKPVIDMIHPDDRTRCKDNLARVLAGEGRQDVSFRMLTAKGDAVYLKGRLTPGMKEDEIESLAAYLVDVTSEQKYKKEHQQLTEQLTHLQKAELMGTMVGGIAHDFNNILAPVLGYTQLAIADAEQPEMVREYLQQVETAVERLREMVSQLVNLNKKREHIAREVVVQDIINEATDLARASIPHSIEMVIKMSPQNITIEVDPTELHQIILNLCTNASKAVDGSSGSIVVKLYHVDLNEIDPVLIPELDNKKHSGVACLEVEDTGVGMSKEVMDRVFEPFFTTRDKTEGTGLGLAVVHSIVSRFGGTIHVKSIEGHGSRFIIYMPIVHSNKSIVERKNVQKLTGSGRILLVDDEERVAQVIRKMLQRSGYEVTVKSDGLAGLQELENGSGYDLILSDLTMPNLNGADFALAAAEVAPSVPFIIMSGYRDAESLASLTESNVFSVLEKPVKLADLQRMVSEALVS
ncbi:MAG: hybrid sensor histidine kinase/response regulator [bacterium]